MQYDSGPYWKRKKESDAERGTSCEDTDPQREDAHGMMEAEME